jgi:uncharacterized phiE125 gp8 family phage protein
MIRSIATITVDPVLTALTTLQRAKDELSITDSASDALLTAKIDEASSDIEAHTNRIFAKATLSETFWCDAFEGYRQGHSRHLNSLTLARAPVASITSVTVDDVVVAASEYRLDAQSGLLFRLTSDGFPSVWCWSKSVVIVYVAGYDLPGAATPNLPPALQAAALSLLNSYWQSRGRDPMVRGESIPGLGDVQYWVGSVGEAGQLPPDVMAKITPFRRYIIG